MHARVFPPDMTVREARDEYLAINGFTTKSYTEPTFVNYVGPFPIRFPNPGLFQWHDLHHVATGYGTDLIGEGEISAHELRTGCGTALIAFLCFGSVLIALFLAPIRVIRAWRRARGTRDAYARDAGYDELLAMTVGELRKRLGLPIEGLSNHIPGRRRGAPKLD